MVILIFRLSSINIYNKILLLPGGKEKGRVGVGVGEGGDSPPLPHFIFNTNYPEETRSDVNSINTHDPLN